MSAEILPFDADAERAVIGSILQEPEAFSQLSALVNIGDFHSEKHRRIWGAMVGLYEAGSLIDHVTVATWLRDADHLESVGGLTYLSSIDDQLGALKGGDYYALRVREKSILRQTIHACSKLIAECQSNGDSREVLQRGEQVLRDLNAASNQDRRLAKAGEIIHECGGMESFMRGTSADVPLPWPRVNEVLAGGFRRSELIVLAAATSGGKTAAASQIAAYAALRHTIPTAVFSLEMSKRDLLMRMAIEISGVDGSFVRTNRMDKEQRGKLREALLAVDQAPIWFDDKASASVASIHAALRSKGGKFGLVVVDYLQLVQAIGKHSSRTEAVGALSRGLKVLAMDFDVPVLALSQINRAADDFTEPELRHLRESGSIEQDANTVMFVWRKEKPDPLIPFVRAGMSVAKQRNGPAGVMVDMLYHKAQLRFEQELEGGY